MRGTVVDTVAAVTFFTVVGAAVEYLIAGLSPAQVVVTRGTMIPVLLLTGRPYGLWRDLVLRASGARRRGPVVMYVADTLAFLTFKAPIYAAVLLLAGASLVQVAAAVGSGTVAALALSRPFGVFLDWLRRRTGVVPETPL
jgi:hypothetical protein